MPAVVRYVLHAGARPGGLEVFDVDRDRPDSELPPDFVLQELLQAADDDESLASLMQEWGLLVSLREGGVVNLAEARWRLRELQALAGHVLAYRDGDDSALLAAWSWSGWHGSPQGLSQAWLWFQDILNSALKPFSMHVRLSEDDSAVLARAQPTLYHAAALQIAQLLNGPHVRRCANDRCGKPFTVQRSPRRRYQNTQHSAGVRYCSHLCAKAQSERDRRARRRDEKEQP